MNNHPPGPARLPTRDERDAIRMPRKADRFPRLSPPDVSDDNVGNAGCLLVTLLAVPVGSLIFWAAWKGLGLW